MQMLAFRDPTDGGILWLDLSLQTFEIDARFHSYFHLKVVTEERSGQKGIHCCIVKAFLVHTISD
jgi:hypothetical protein